MPSCSSAYELSVLRALAVGPVLDDVQWVLDSLYIITRFISSGEQVEDSTSESSDSDDSDFVASTSAESSASDAEEDAQLHGGTNKLHSYGLYSNQMAAAIFLSQLGGWQPCRLPAHMAARWPGQSTAQSHQAAVTTCTAWHSSSTALLTAFLTPTPLSSHSVTTPSLPLPASGTSHSTANPNPRTSHNKQPASETIRELAHKRQCMTACLPEPTTPQQHQLSKHDVLRQQRADLVQQWHVQEQKADATLCHIKALQQTLSEKQEQLKGHKQKLSRIQQQVKALSSDAAARLP